jgi:hypothetical protein
METGLFEIQAEHLRVYPQNCSLLSDSHAVAVFRRASARAASGNAVSSIGSGPGSGMKADAPNVEFARCYLRLANLPNSRSTVLAAMRRSSGVKPAGFFTRSRLLIVANRRSERAVFVLPAPKECQVLSVNDNASAVRLHRRRHAGFATDSISKR